MHSKFFFNVKAFAESIDYKNLLDLGCQTNEQTSENNPTLNWVNGITLFWPIFHKTRNCFDSHMKSEIMKKRILGFCLGVFTLAVDQSNAFHLAPLRTRTIIPTSTPCISQFSPHRPLTDNDSHHGSLYSPRYTCRRRFVSHLHAGSFGGIELANVFYDSAETAFGAWEW